MRDQALKITHLPTGIVIVVDDHYGRSMHSKKLMGLKILQSKLWMKENFKQGTK